MRTILSCLLVIPALLASAGPADARQTAPMRLAIAGLVHGHVGSFLWAAQSRKDVQIVGIFEANPELLKSYAKQHGFAEDLLFTDLAAMLTKTQPEAVASFTNTLDHPKVVEAAAARRIHVMMEKPLAVSNADALRIKRAAEKAGIQVFVNYETTWYRSHAAMWPMIKERKEFGDIRKMVAMDGHNGPTAIKVQPEFLDWLRDPVRNGAGALYDFGCYGANLMTWMMDNQRPIAVTAITQQFQPESYPKVDDEATIVVEYPRAQGIIQASWNWPIGRKDFEVYGERGWAIATAGNSLRVAQPGVSDHPVTLDLLPPDQTTSISHLIAVARGTVKPNALSSLENNMIVTEILEAARESARTRKRVMLGK